MLEGGYTKAKRNGKTDLKRGVLKGEAKYTFKWCSYLFRGERVIKDMGKTHGFSAPSKIYRKGYNPLLMCDRTNHPQATI